MMMMILGWSGWTVDTGECRVSAQDGVPMKWREVILASDTQQTTITVPFIGTSQFDRLYTISYSGQSYFPL